VLVLCLVLVLQTPQHCCLPQQLQVPAGPCTPLVQQAGACWWGRAPTLGRLLLCTPGPPGWQLRAFPSS
jgi:hypothetical protein